MYESNFYLLLLPIYNSKCQFGSIGTKSLTKGSYLFSTLDKDQLWGLCMLSLELSINMPDTFTNLNHSFQKKKLGGKHQEMKLACSSALQKNIQFTFQADQFLPPH